MYEVKDKDAKPNRLHMLMDIWMSKKSTNELQSLLKMSVFLQTISPAGKHLDDGLTTQCLHTVKGGQYVIIL